MLESEDMLEIVTALEEVCAFEEGGAPAFLETDVWELESMLSESGLLRLQGCMNRVKQYDFRQYPESDHFTLCKYRVEIVCNALMRLLTSWKGERAAKLPKLEQDRRNKKINAASSEVSRLRSSLILPVAQTEVERLEMLGEQALSATAPELAPNDSVDITEPVSVDTQGVFHTDNRFKIDGGGMWVDGYQGVQGSEYQGVDELAAQKLDMTDADLAALDFAFGTCAKETVQTVHSTQPLPLNYMFEQYISENPDALDNLYSQTSTAKSELMDSLMDEEA
ncbi:hypothetical protein NDN08_006174 [Rhodosorus marinus]|uniref:Uncharacterized protein n=1 Tax=Rhodosorus marinus TaxID=101924 RepID=A0AAV8UK09_9RHOD|nr:hypothetical protein NDN08_006174 [Rhodosorus marinus]